jgi:hypothetical protein
MWPILAGQSKKNHGSPTGIADFLAEIQIWDLPTKKLK